MERDLNARSGFKESSSKKRQAKIGHRKWATSFRQEEDGAEPEPCRSESGLEMMTKTSRSSRAVSS
jgi:hypothetical protein